MSKKVVKDDQPDLFSLLEPVDVAQTLAPSVQPYAAPAVQPASRDALLEQILRDEQTLRLGPNWWVPSRDFFVERVASYHEALVLLSDTALLADEPTS